MNKKADLSHVFVPLSCFYIREMCVSVCVLGWITCGGVRIEGGGREREGRSREERQFMGAWLSF